MKRIQRIGVAGACFLVMGFGAAMGATTLLVDDFNRGEKPNALGGDFGSWDKDPNDPTQKCTISFDKVDPFGGVGYSLKIDYDVDSPNPAYNGVWMDLKGSDLSSYKQLVLYVKGDATRGHTSQVKLEIKNGSEVGRYTLKGITDDWQQVRIPLSEFQGISSWMGIKEFVMVFDDVTSTKKVGTLYLDEIAFES